MEDDDDRSARHVRSEPAVNLPELLLAVEVTHVESAVEAEWNEWYDNVHLPMVLQCPGFVEGIRYEVQESRYGPGDGYLTIYQLQSAAALGTTEFLSVRGWSRFESSVDAKIRLFRRREI